MASKRVVLWGGYAKDWVIGLVFVAWHWFSVWSCWWLDIIKQVATFKKRPFFLNWAILLLNEVRKSFSKSKINWSSNLPKAMCYATKAHFIYSLVLGNGTRLNLLLSFLGETLLVSVLRYMLQPKIWSPVKIYPSLILSKTDRLCEAARGAGQ